MSKKCVFALSALFLILFTSCGKKEETTPAAVPDAATAPAPAPPPAGVQAGTIGLGKAIGPDKKVTTPAEAFAKGDTFYASVDTTGTGTAMLKAKWTYHKGGQTTVVEEQSQTINPTGPATTEFHVSKPGGWPAGEYQVELFLDDKPIGMRSFTVA
jgi:hypothetical protein